MNLFTLFALVYDSLMTAIHRRQEGQLLEYLTPWQDKKVLDAGGGTGKLASRMEKVGATVWILDTSPQMLKRARRLLPAERCLLGDVASMPFDDETFDYVVAVDAFHHFRQQQKMLQESQRVLSPGGTIAILDFNRASHYVRALAWLERLAREPGLFLTPQELTTMLLNNGFTAVQTRYMGAHDYMITALKI